MKGYIEMIRITAVAATTNTIAAMQVIGKNLLPSAVGMKFARIAARNVSVNVALRPGMPTGISGPS
jgi:hypothetical protein